MQDELDHEACVNAWLARTARSMPPSHLLQVFEGALNALWQRAERILGDVTLMAIADRIFYTATERFPFLSSIKVESGGVRCGAFDERTEAPSRAQLVDGLRFLLIEFLTVLGNLTADILTPALHAELSGTAPDVSSPRPRVSSNDLQSSRRKCEDPES